MSGPAAHADASVVEQVGRGGEAAPIVSVVVLNYNGAAWLPRCLESLRSQTIAECVEMVLVDNGSKDGSIEASRAMLGGFPHACVVWNHANLGFCAGNNRGALAARGRWLFFLNYDTWLEPDCLEKLLAGMEETGADGGTPWVLNYADDSHQDLGYFGFDLFGLASPSAPATRPREIFIATGCSLLIRAEVFQRIGRFDPEFFLYSDEVDLCWRVWLGGHRLAGIPAARLHHRGAANVNPAGGAEVIEFRTSDQKRFLANRNCLLTLWKNGQHLLLLPLLPMTALFLAESLVGALLLRRASFVRAAFWDALKDAWRLRAHVGRERRAIAGFRRRSDFWMLRFFRLPLNRWFEIKRLFRFGAPRVDSR